MVESAVRPEAYRLIPRLKTSCKGDCSLEGGKIVTVTPNVSENAILIGRESGRPEAFHASRIVLIFKPNRTPRPESLDACTARDIMFGGKNLLSNLQNKRITATVTSESTHNLYSLNRAQNPRQPRSIAEPSGVEEILCISQFMSLPRHSCRAAALRGG